MKRFTYEAVDRAGQPARGSIEAADWAAALEILEDRGQRGLVAAVCGGKRGLADARIAADQHQRREAARTQIDRARFLRECLEARGLREPQVKPDPVRERPEIHILVGSPFPGRNGFAFRSAGESVLLHETNGPFEADFRIRGGRV